MFRIFQYAIILIFLAGVAGCAEGPELMKWVRIDNAERDSLCVALTKSLADKLSFENNRKKEIDHGRIEIYADIRNRENSPLTLQLSTVFRDDAGQVVDTTIWKTYHLGANETLAYRCSSVTKAKTYTVRIK